MGVSLVLVKADGGQQEVPIRHATEVIGRHNDCRIRIPDASVSRQHCEISVKDGRVLLRDLGSSNGTFVNRKRVAQTELAAADLLNIGKFVFVVRIDGRPEMIDSDDALEDGLVALPAAASAPSASAAPRAAAAPAPAPPKPASKPAPKSDPDDSSVFDFDFLDEKDAPKL